MSIQGYMHQQLWYTYGRYGNALALALLGKLFYTASVIVAPLFLIIILAGSAYYATTAFGLRKLRAVAASLAATAFLLTCVPSIFDTLYWMNSSTLYPLAIAGSLFVAGTTIKIWTRDNLTVWKLAVALCVALFVGGINEFSPAINITIIALVCLAWQGKRYQWRPYAIGAMLTTQLLAFTILKWAPGSVHRQTLQQSGANSILHISKQSLLVIAHFIPTLSAWNITLLITAAATVALTVYNREVTNTFSKDKWRKVVALLILSAALFIVPVFTTQYAHSIRENGQPPYRAQTYLIAGLMLALTTLIWLFNTALRLRSNVFKNVLLLLVLVFVFVSSLTRITNVGKALTSRAFSYDQRATVASLQIKSGKKVLSLPEVPVYAVSDSQDLPPTNDPSYVSSWVSVVFAEYMGVGQVKTDNSKSLQGCPAVNNQYDNRSFCESVYKTVSH
jgi:hypothetical protein